MARYNKIYAGPFTEAMPQVQEAISAVAILPGIAVSFTAAGAYAIAGAATTDKVYIAQDNYLTLSGVDVAYPVGDTVIGMELLDEQFFNVRVAPAQVIVRGSKLTTNATGLFVLATAGQRVIMIAEEAFTTTGTAELVRARKAGGETVAA